MTNQPDRHRWTWALDSDDPHTPAWLVAMFYADRRLRRDLRAILAELAEFPDLTLDVTEGRGWRRRNIRIRVTGPVFAITTAYRVFRNHLEGTD